MNITDDTRSHRDFKRQFEFTDGDPDSATYGQPIDFTGAFIAIAIDDSDHCYKILATTDNGKITIIDTGIIEISLSETDMGLAPGTYPIGGYYQLNGETNDLFTGELTVQTGIPRP